MEKSLHKKIIDKIETELLSTLFNYVVPFIDKKIKSKKFQRHVSEFARCERAHSHVTEIFLQNKSNLENIVNTSKPKIGFKEFKELEDLLLKNLSENVKNNKNAGINSNNFSYSLNLIRKKSEQKSNNYSINIKYEENETEEKLSFSIKKAENEIYSGEITTKKDVKDKATPYSIKINYRDNYAEERLSITYNQQLKNYLLRHLESKEDMTNRVPLKWLNILPETIMGGVLGFTYLGENFMVRRADLTGKTARMVDIHESIHTPDEYETRVLTSWIMEKVRPKYVK